MTAATKKFIVPFSKGKSEGGKGQKELLGGETLELSIKILDQIFSTKMCFLSSSTFQLHVITNHSFSTLRQGRPALRDGENGHRCATRIRHLDRSLRGVLQVRPVSGSSRVSPRFHYCAAHTVSTAPIYPFKTPFSRLRSIILVPTASSQIFSPLMMYHPPSPSPPL